MRRFSERLIALRRAFACIATTGKSAIRRDTTPTFFCEITTSAIRDSEEKLRLLFDTIPQLDTHTLELARDVIERQVHNLVRLVDDLLDVSRVMRGKIELKRESLELAEVVSRAIETA